MFLTTLATIVASATFVIVRITLLLERKIKHKTNADKKSNILMFSRQFAFTEKYDRLKGGVGEMDNL